MALERESRRAWTLALVAARRSTRRPLTRRLRRTRDDSCCARYRSESQPASGAKTTNPTCYDHLAGQLGVSIADALVQARAIELDDDAGLVTDVGIKYLRRAGIDVFTNGASGAHSPRPLCRPCLDWSERRFHIAGKLGAAICRHPLEQRWLRRVDDTRALDITSRGRAALREAFAISDA